MPELFAEVLQCPRRFVFGRRIARLIALRGVRSVLALVGVTLLLSACASVPSQEMSDARRALDAAEQAEARRLLPLAMKRASTTLESANSALRAGQYDEARQLAREARDEAIAVRVLAGRSEEIRHSVASARAQGRAWQDMDQLMQRAIAMSRNGDIKGALSLSEKAIGMLR
ncbi:MAG: hypothetical protein ACI9DC_000993 [Gammaproteobacteria bacterium]